MVFLVGTIFDIIYCIENANKKNQIRMGYERSRHQKRST